MMMMMMMMTTTTIDFWGFNGTVLHFAFKTEMNAAECIALPWQIKKKKYFSEHSLYFQGT